jgi:hypothetical protein
MVAVMVVETKVKMPLVVDLVVAQAQQQMREVILDLQIQIVIQPDKGILEVQDHLTEVVEEVVPIVPDLLDLEFLRRDKVQMVLLSQASLVHTEQQDQHQVDGLLVVDQQVSILLQEPQDLEVLVVVEQEKVMILSVEMALLTLEVVEEVQVVDLLTPMVDLVVLVLLLFDTNHNK